MRSKIGDKERLQHIRDICFDIENAIVGYDEEKFLNDFLVRTAVCSCVVWIGEASTHLTDEIKNSKPDIEWIKIKGMRNLITHEYFGIDYKTLFKAVADNIPPLKKSCD